MMYDVQVINGTVRSAFSATAAGFLYNVVSVSRLCRFGVTDARI